MTSKPWPFNKLREPTPADWGVGMTIGIAAYCVRQKAFILASDMMISTGDMSADFVGIKSRGIGQHWITLFAGNDISCVTPMLKHISAFLQGIPDTLENVTKAFTNSFHAQLKLKNENEILRPLGYTLGRFQKVGLQQLGSDTFSRLLYSIERQTLDVEFLVAGFEKDDAHLFTVKSPGTISNYTPLGFWAIGSGQTNALGSMFNAGNLVFSDIASTIYRVCEAKFNSESAIGIGKKTVLSILNQDATRWISPLDLTESVRPFWEKTRVLKVPTNAHVKTQEMWTNAQLYWAEQPSKTKLLSTPSTSQTSELEQ